MGVILKQNIVNELTRFNAIHKQLSAEQLNTVCEQVNNLAQYAPTQTLIIDGVQVQTPIIRVAVKLSNLHDDNVDGVNYDVLSEDSLNIVVIDESLVWVKRSCDFYFHPDEDDEVAFIKNDSITKVDITTMADYRLAV